VDLLGFLRWIPKSSILFSSFSFIFHSLKFPSFKLLNSLFHSLKICRASQTLCFLSYQIVPKKIHATKTKAYFFIFLSKKPTRTKGWFIMKLEATAQMPNKLKPRTIVLYQTDTKTTSDQLISNPLCNKAPIQNFPPFCRLS